MCPRAKFALRGPKRTPPRPGATGVASSRSSEISRATKRTSCLREAGRRDCARGERSPERCGLSRFTTFLIVRNSLSAAQIKERKTLATRSEVPSGPRRFRERRRRSPRRGLQRQQFPSTFPLFNYTVALGPPAIARRIRAAVRPA